MRKFILKLIFIFISLSLVACSQTPETCLKKGDEYYRQRDYSSAIEQYNVAIKLNPNFVIAYINKGQALEFLRRFPDAIATYTLLLKRIPGETNGLTRRGITFIKIQDFRDGINDLQQANKQDPNNSQILANLGLAKVRIKDTSGIKELDRAIILDKTNFEAIYNRGLGKLLIKNYDAAIKDFESAIVLKPLIGETYFSIGLCKFQQGNKIDACKYWKISVEKGYVRAQTIIDQNCN